MIIRAITGAAFLAAASFLFEPAHAAATQSNQASQALGDEPSEPVAGPALMSIIGPGDAPQLPPGDIQARYNSYELDSHDDSLAGDHIDLDTGALSLSHTDISIPGNSALPVALTRTKSRNEPNYRWLGNWQVGVPYISRHYIAEVGANADRCTGQLYPDTIFYGVYELRAPSYFSGLTLSVPGQSPGALTEALNGGNSPEFSGTNARMVTTENWVVTCLSSIAAGGEGFVATAPDGTRYTFDEVRSFHDRDIKLNDTYVFTVNEEVLFVSEVEDPHGNWVRYDYDANGLTRIWSNDGREITLSWSGDQIVSATANGRTWTYQYNGTNLNRVTLPDSRYWTFSEYFMAHDDRLRSACAHWGSPSSIPDVTIRHPDGAVIDYEFAVIKNGRTHVPFIPRDTGFAPPNIEACHVGSGQASTPSGFYSFAVTAKTITLPGGEIYTWTRSYEEDDGSYSSNPGSLSDTKSRTVTDPFGHRTVYHFNRRFGPFEGSLEQVEIIPSGQSTPLQTIVHSYSAGNVVGIELRGREHDNLNNPASSTRVYQTQSSVTLHGETYTTTRTYQTDPAASDFAYGQPHTVSRSSTLASGTRTVTYSYAHLKTPWILGLLAQETRNGTVFEAHGYTGLGRRTHTDRFGVRVADYSYNADGTMAWYEDALGRRTSFAGWRRGVPQTLTFPDTYTLLRTVDDDGRVTALTDRLGATTAYVHNAAGWLTRIDRPSGNSDITISYSGLGSGVVQTIDHGALRTIVEHDAMLRPVREERRALVAGGGSIFTRFEYDALGRTIFASFPSASSNPLDGVDTTYDALGRVVRTEENVAPYAATVTEFLSNNRVRVTDPVGNVTTSWRSGYGGPDDGETVRIDHPLGLTTEMTHDAWGNMLTARQFGTHSGYTVDETQVWAYDNRLRLCRHSTPQEGHTLYEYDAASQLIGVARGAPAGTGCNSLPAALTVDTTYDLMGRVDRVIFPDSPDIDLDYDANGNLTRAARGSAVWTYAYDAMDRVLWEHLDIDGRSYMTSHRYGADGRYYERTTPSGRGILYAPNGHGQPRWARIGQTYYASNGVYHPSGQLAAADYANGLDYLATFDARHQMTSQRVSAGASDRLRYSYGRDALGRVTTITDHVRPAQTRSYGYDPLGRLVSASGEWGAGSYTYDLLNNIREKALGLRTVELQYDSSGRLDRYRDTDAGFTWRDQLYDGRGNVTSDGVHGFSYDASGQPYAISGGATGSFVYDAHRRRVKQTLNGQTIYTIYGLDGTLYFRDNATTGETTDYVRMGAHSVGRMDETGAFTWTHSDHLGSASAATNSAGTIVWRESYTPFGEAIEDPAANRDEAGFTGHIRDAATGLTYAQARYYNPVTARFLAPDPAGFADMGPGYFNRYAYTMNDPVNLVDPEGEQAIPGWAYQQQLARDRAMRSGNPGELDRVVAQQARDNAVAAGVVIAVFTPGPDELLLAGIAAKTVRSANGARAGNDALDVYVSPSRYPETAAHIRDAQAAGHPQILTIDRANAAANRADAGRGAPRQPGHDLDEYPPAMTVEGGVGASTRSVSAADNRGAGAAIGNQCRGASCGARIRIKPEEPPKG
jgi:RHS repeat-associated protein